MKSLVLLALLVWSTPGLAAEAPAVGPGAAAAPASPPQPARPPATRTLTGQPPATKAPPAKAKAKPAAKAPASAARPPAPRKAAGAGPVKRSEAGEAAPTGPIAMKSRKAHLKFDHAQHPSLDCVRCHQGVPGKIAGLPRDAPHQYCVACHKAEGKGPKACKECHPR
ncbi:MAG: hypothetical protein IPO09_19180 [Anaeromyxobacter sp.]|nr:hypothetical protein [Anaeromyxobacter sp.]MBL0275991.1 hypothetical protein [Anaeromyxobacter sp.]